MVFAGFDPRLERPVAIKRLIRDAVLSDDGGAALQSEARYAARLSHPGIVRLYDFLCVDGIEYIISELVEGVSLAELTASTPNRLLPVERVLEIGVAIADALAYAHENGIVHRDVKAANVLLDKNGQVKLTDFGISTAICGLGPPRAPEGAHAHSGTFSAMSPEQSIGDYTDARSDLFSLGALLYELLSGSAPFAASDPAACLRLVRSLRLPPLSELLPSLPVQVSKLVESLLEKRRDDRPESAREVSEALTAALNFVRGMRSNPEGESVIERQVATVCVRLDADAKVNLGKAKERAQLEVSELIHDAVARAGGTLFASAGSLICFCIGYPVSQENNCEHALRLLFDVAAAASERELTLTAGIDCGSVALVHRPQVVLASGSAVERALGIAQQGESGSISLTLAAQTLVRRFFRFLPMTRSLGEREKHVQVYRVVDAISHDAGIEQVSTTPLQSRDEQLEKLDRAFLDAARGAVVTRLLVGDPGVGKSRLLHEWRRSAEAADLILTVYATAHERSLPFTPLIRTLRGWFGLHPSEDPAVNRRKLRESLEHAGLRVEEACEAFDHVLEIASPDNPVSAVTAERRRQSVVQAFVALVTGLAETRTIVMVFEDAHFMDRSTLEVMQRLVENPKRVSLLILITARPEFTSNWPLAQRVAQIDVRRLEPTEALRLIESVAAPHVLPVALSRKLLELGDGVPLALEELTRVVMEGARLRQSDTGAWLSEHPTSLADSVASRLEHLGPAKEMIRLAAALGRESPLELLRAVAAAGNEEFRSRLHKLEAAGLIHLRRTPAGEMCVFSHALVHDAVQGTLTATASREIHARIVEVLDQSFAELVATSPGRFARAYAEAGALARALKLFELAAQRALDSSAYHEASEHLQAALSLVQASTWQGGVADEQRLRRLLGPCLMAIEGWSSKAVEENLSRSQVLSDATDLRDLWGLWAHGIVTHDAAKVQAAVHAVAAFPGSPEQRFATHSMRGVTAFYRGQFSFARQSLEQAVAMLPSPGGGRPDDAIDLEVARSWGCEFTVAACLHLAWLEAFCDRRDRLSALHSQAKDLLDGISREPERSEVRHALYMRVHIGLTLRDYESFDYSKFADGEGELFRLFELAGTRFPYYRCVAMIGETCARATFTGDAIAEMLEAYERMKALARQPTGHVFFATVLAETCLDARRVDRASALICEALSVTHSKLGQFYASEAHRVDARCRLALDDLPGAQEAIRRARSAALALGAPPEAPLRLFESRLADTERAIMLAAQRAVQLRA